MAGLHDLELPGIRVFQYAVLARSWTSAPFLSLHGSKLKVRGESMNALKTAVLLGLLSAILLVGGGLLILGVQTRVVALALVPVLLGATWVHAGNGWLFTSPKGGWEYPAFWTVALIVQALLGDGAFALRPWTVSPSTQRA